MRIFRGTLFIVYYLLKSFLTHTKSRFFPIMELRIRIGQRATELFRKRVLFQGFLELTLNVERVTPKKDVIVLKQAVDYRSKLLHGR